MNTWLPIIGKLEIDGMNVRIRLPMDFIAYYKQFVDKHMKFFTNFPAHGAHVTVGSVKTHPNLKKSDIAFLRNTYIHVPIKLEYNPDIIMGGLTRDFRNFFAIVRGEPLEQMVRILNIKEPNRGFHATISNTKGGTRPYVFFTQKPDKDYKSV